MTPQQVFFYETLPQLLAQLTADTQPRWGKMSAQHMVEHVSAITYLALGKRELPVMTPPEVLEKSRAWLMSDKPFRPDTKAPMLPAEPLPLSFASLDEAKQKLLDTIEAFRKRFDENPDLQTVHPVFGLLDRAQWEQFHYKHCRHHFTQFGLIEAESPAVS